VTRKKVDQADRMKAMERFAAEDGQRSSTFSLMKQDTASSPGLLDYAWQQAARAALKIEDLTKWRSPDGVWHDVTPGFVDTVARDMRLTFKKFKLDPDDPWSWRTMAQYMSLLFSAPQSKKGRPSDWTLEKLELLRQERESDRFKNLTNGQVAHELANDKRSPFHAQGVNSKAGVEGLRKRLGKLGTK
jgi:hypothetical protein